MSYMESELQKNSKLVLMFEHQEHGSLHKIDLRIFLLWDPFGEKYMLFGRRQSAEPRKNAPPFYFEFASYYDAYCFVKRAIGTKESLGLTLYNFNNLISVLSQNLDFEFFEELMDRRYEIAGYDSCSFHENKRIIKDLILSLESSSSF